MAAKAAQVLTERDDDDGDDDAAEARGAVNSDAQVLRPITTPPISRSDAKADQAPQIEIVEVDEDDNPIGEVGAGPSRESDLSQESSGERPVIGTAEGADDGRRKPSYRQETSAERRERKKLSRDRHSQKLAKLQRDLDDMRGQMSEFAGRVEPRLNDFDASRAQGLVAQMDSDIARHTATIQAAGVKQREAMSNNDADAFMAAQSAREDAVVAKARAEVRREQLIAAQGQADRGGGRQEGSQGDGATTLPRPAPGAARPAAAQKQLPIAAQRYAREFQETHDWYDPGSADPDVRRDSNRVLLLDHEVAADGFDPQTPEYWDELESRMREFVPGAFEDEGVQHARREQARPNGASGRGNGGRPASANGRSAPVAAPSQRRGPLMADVGGRGNANEKNQVRITPERKRAMIESGSLGVDGRPLDQAKFNRQMAKFLEHDRANGAG